MSQALAVSDAQSASQNIQANLTFIVPQDTKPSIESAALTGGDPVIHFDIHDEMVDIFDMRDQVGELSLDRHGFELHRHKSTVRDFYDDGEIESAYNAETQAMLKNLTGADEVAIFDHTRRSDSAAGAANPDGQRFPAGRVHVDYTVKSGPIRARDAIGAEKYDRLIDEGARIVQINVWRPIAGPVLRSPLALADASTVAPKELVATDHKFPGRTGEIFQVAYGPGQKWYWAPEMTSDEILLIKGWDSIDDGRAIFTPHSAFQLQGENDHLPPRQSIETRTYLVFHPKG